MLIISTLEANMLPMFTSQYIKIVQHIADKLKSGPSIYNANGI